MGFRAIFSFVVDASPHFAYQGFHLARSILEHCDVDAGAIHVHVTPELSACNAGWRSSAGEVERLSLSVAQ